MRMFSFAVRLGVVLIPLAMGCAQSPAGPIAITIKPSADGILGGTGTVKAGAHVRVVLTLTNLSGRDITLHFTSAMCDYALEVRDSSGALAPDTEEKRGANCANPVTGRNIYRALKPSESTRDALDVGQMSDMSQPGQYSVQVMRASPELGGTAAISNAITITVAQ